MRPVKNFILVQVEKRFNDVFEAPDGMILFKHLLEDGNKEQDVIIHAPVVAIPDDIPTSGFAKGIHKDVRVGDEVYFKYLSLLSEENWIPTEDGKFWRIPYQDVFCAVRDGDIIPIGGWVLVEPVKEKAVSTFLIDPFKDKVKNETVGIVRHIGKPRMGMPDMQRIVGEAIFFPKDCAFENEIEGTVYYCMEQKMIYGTIKEEAAQ